MTDTQSNPLDGKARMIELLQQMRDAARPEGIFERLAVQRLVGAWWHFERFIALAMQRVHTDEAPKHQKNALRWEACYNRAMRELRTLQTARAILHPEEAPPPMANLQQLQHFAKRTAPPPASSPAKSPICETNSHSEQVGRNSSCPCGSGKKFKRCCGLNAPPIYNQAA